MLKLSKNQQIIILIILLILLILKKWKILEGFGLPETINNSYKVMVAESKNLQDQVKNLDNKIKDMNNRLNTNNLRTNQINNRSGHWIHIGPHFKVRHDGKQLCMENHCIDHGDLWYLRGIRNGVHIKTENNPHNNHHGHHFGKWFHLHNDRILRVDDDAKWRTKLRIEPS